MKRWLAASWWALVPLLLQAQTDPLASPECQAARAELDAARAAAGSTQAQPDERLTRAQGQAKLACLGRSPPRERSGAPEPPITVAPSVAIPKSPTSPPTLQAAPPPVAIPRPTVITNCDASGCWDSEGRRLNSAGPTLMGPRGLCSGSGSVIICP
jgi:hypothetical protein